MFYSCFDSINNNCNKSNNSRKSFNLGKFIIERTGRNMIDFYGELVICLRAVRKRKDHVYHKPWSISYLLIRPLSIEKLQVEGEGNRNRNWVVANSVVTSLVIK